METSLFCKRSYFIIFVSHEKAIRSLKNKLEAVEKEFVLNVEHCLK